MLVLQEAAQALLDCVCDSLRSLPTESVGAAGCPCRVGVVPGSPAADGCDGGCGPVGPDEYPGQLTVSVLRLFTSSVTDFPREVQPVRDRAGCTPHQIAAELVVTLWRCAPMPTDDGCPPPMSELELAAFQYHLDMMAVQRGIVCCFAATDTTTRRGRKFAVGPSTTIGPQGGCVGFQTRVLVALGNGFTPTPPGP